MTHPQGWTDQSETQPIGVGPSAAPPAPEQPADEQPNSQRSRSRLDGSTVRIVLHVVAAVLVVAGISIPLDGWVLWTSSAAWSAFAALAALTQVAAIGPRSSLGGHAWWIGAGGAAGLVLFWTLLMLPVISTNMAFLVTLGTAISVATVLTSPDRRI